MRRSKNFWGGAGAGAATTPGVPVPFGAQPANAAPAAAAPSAASAARRERSMDITAEDWQSAAGLCIGFEDTPASARLIRPMAVMSKVQPLMQTPTSVAALNGTVSQ